MTKIMSSFLIKPSIIKIFCLLIFFTTLCACQPSPENKVWGKSNYRKFEKLVNTQASSEDKLVCPANYYDDLISKDGKVSIKIDAIVSVPEVDKYPVIRMNIVPFSKETIKRVAEEFVEGNDGLYPRDYLTKNEIEGIILFLKSRLSNEKGLLKELGSTEAYNTYVDECNQRLQYYEELLIDAPLTSDSISTEFVLRPIDFYYELDSTKIQNELSLSEEQLDNREINQNTNLYLISTNKTTDGIYTRLSVYHDYLKNVLDNNSYFKREQYQMQVIKTYTPLINDFGFSIDQYPFNRIEFQENFDSGYQTLSIDQTRAETLARSALDDLGLTDLYLADVRVIKKNITYKDIIKVDTGNGNLKNLRENKDDVYYLLTFKPNYYGIPLLNAYQMFVDEVEYCMQIETEEIKVRVSNDMIAEFRWTNPTDVSDIINDNVKLIDFDTIISNAKSFMALKYNMITVAPVNPESQTYEDDIKKYISANINIDEIKLGLGSIPEYNNPNEYILIPIWNFYGSYNISTQDEKEKIEVNDMIEPLVSINALDGSIISQKSIISYD